MEIPEAGVICAAIVFLGSYLAIDPRATGLTIAALAALWWIAL